MSSSRRARDRAAHEKTRVVQHGHDLVAARRDLSVVRFAPVHVVVRVHQCRRRIGRDRYEVLGRKLGAQLVEQSEQAGVTIGARLDVEMNAGEAMVLAEQTLRGSDEAAPPVFLVEKHRDLETPPTQGITRMPSSSW